MKTRSISNRQIAEEAAEWAVRIDIGNLAAAERKDLATWLRTSPVHVAELLMASSLLSGMGEADCGGRISAGDLEHLGAEIVPLFEAEYGQSGPQESGEALRASPRFNRQRALVAASVGALIFAASAFALIARHDSLAGTEYTTSKPVLPQAELVEPVEVYARNYSTDVGEQLSVVLEDGSIVHINADSRIQVIMGEAARNVHLVRGEALFEVAHDEDRPFRVHAEGTVAQAVGTKFNVDRTGDGIRVTVVEGRVLVNNASPSLAPHGSPEAQDGKTWHQPVMLTAGQLVEMRSNAQVRLVSQADLEAVISWRKRELTFDNDGLDTIADKFNRYNTTQIVLADPGLSDEEFSGVFSADDPDSFLAFLELTGRFSLDRSQSGRVVLHGERR